MEYLDIQMTFVYMVYSSYNRFDIGQLYKGLGEFAWNGTDRFVAVPKVQMKVKDSNAYYKDGRINETAVETNGVYINGAPQGITSDCAHSTLTKDQYHYIREQISHLSKGEGKSSNDKFWLENAY